MKPISVIAEQFTDSINSITSLGNGLINDTYRVASDSSSLVLQRINQQVFPEPAQIMANLQQLTAHISQKSPESVKLKIPALIPTHTQHDFFVDAQGQYWRALQFIENTQSLEFLTSLQQAQQVGFALGHFHFLVSDLKADGLYDTLPGFHITPSYFAHYQAVLSRYNGKLNNLSEFCRDFIAQHEAWIPVLENAKHQGDLVLRVIHGDPKLNNFLFDASAQSILSLIDLDTVKPGLVHYDIGDCLRSACNQLGTNEFDLEICQVILKSYLAEVKGFFSVADYDYLFAAIQLIPLELGMRFYTDYLEGNRYFKVSDPEQNLQRAVAQFQLSASIARQELDIKAIINQLQLS